MVSHRGFMVGTSLSMPRRFSFASQNECCFFYYRPCACPRRHWYRMFSLFLHFCGCHGCAYFAIHSKVSRQANPAGVNFYVRCGTKLSLFLRGVVSSVSVILKYRCGRLKSLGAEEIQPLRVAMDTTYMNTANAVYGTSFIRFKLLVRCLYLFFPHFGCFCLFWNKGWLALEPCSSCCSVF